MATYRTIAASEVDPDSPVTATLMQALTDNPTAIAEGATDAPVQAAGWHPYDSTNAGDGNDGEFYDFATDGAINNVETPTFSDGYEYKIVFTDLGVSDAAVLEVYFHEETDATYTRFVPLGSTGASDVITGECQIFLPRVTKVVHAGAGHFVRTAGVGSSAAGGGSTGTSQKVDKMRMTMTAGNFNAGTMHLYRRLDYTS